MTLLLFLTVGLGLAGAQSPPNIIFVLSDDHRSDFMGFMEGGPAFLETPALDRMAREGAHFESAFVTTPDAATVALSQHLNSGPSFS